MANIYFIYLFITNLRDAAMKQPETDISKKPSFKCRRENWRPQGKPMEASLDWKPNAHKRRDNESNPGRINTNRL